LLVLDPEIGDYCAALARYLGGGTMIDYCRALFLHRIQTEKDTK